MLSDNTPVSFISDAPKSYLVDISGDAHPRYEVVWKLEDKEPEAVEAEAWIAKKGIAAKGKKCAERGEVKAVRFIEPLVIDEPEIPDQAGDDGQSQTGDDGQSQTGEDNSHSGLDPESPAAPPVIPAEEPESPADLDDVPYLPGDLFEEPTLF